MRRKKVKTKTTRVLVWLGWSLFTALLMLGGVSPAQETKDIAKTIDSNNVAQYKNMLMPALYRAVERGDFILQTGKLNYEYKHWDKFVAAGKKNDGKFDLNAEGDLIDKGSGRQVLRNVYGFPFPNVNPSDPKAGEKIMWNFYYNKHRLMGVRYYSRISWIHKDKGEHRFIIGDSLNNHLLGRPPELAITESQNPNHYSYVELSLVQEPFSMYGMNSLMYDKLDWPDITQFNYIPSIRRIRQSSGVERSDPYMGSDSWTDLGFSWCGKNKTMEWKLVGEQTILVPFTSALKIHAKSDPDGTLFMQVPTIKFGFNTPGWKGAKWATTNAIWVPRKCWIIEQMPRNRYYAWGLHTNYVDQDTCLIWMKEVKDRAGQFRTWTMSTYGLQEGEDGNNNVGLRDAQVTVDEKARHATIGWFLTPKTPEGYAIFEPLSRMPLDWFTKDYLMSMSK
ncbi:MAG: DUF1329 domain-containing protein [Proteobacteria bacterium]|nr:DUF1329 domain-containing protein [Pseudomonadota bacterium]